MPVYACVCAYTCVISTMFDGYFLILSWIVKNVE